jgi:hypothetical protein
LVAVFAVGADTGDAPCKNGAWSDAHLSVDDPQTGDGSFVPDDFDLPTRIGFNFSQLHNRS